MLRLHFLLILGALPAPAGAAQTAVSDEAVRFFQGNCQSCHTIGGGRLSGPDLKNVSSRRDREWLARFIVNPKSVIDSGDAYAQKLLLDARGVYMPAAPGMTKDLAGKLLDLIDVESALEKSRFAGVQVSDRPLTSEDVANGEALFLGRTAFQSGAPACVSCHTTSGAFGLGGGRLGPDLTEAYARLEGRKALAAWLAAPPSLTMQPIYQRAPIESDEVLALVAYLKDQAEHGAETRSPSLLLYFVSGVGLCALMLVLFDFVWRNRYRAVRRPLLNRG